MEEGEQSTKYFMGLEKSKQNSNCIVSLKASNDHIVHTDKEILEVARSFYSDLYQSKATVTSADLNSKFESLIPENILTDQLKEKCDGLLTKNECFQAVK